MGTILILACIVAVLLLLRIDRSNDPGASAGLWVAVSWVFIAGSRSVSSWLGLTPGADAAYDGSPVDAAVFLAHIVAAASILARRDIAWWQLLMRNRLLAVYFAYCLVSAVWAEDSSVTLKRWFKDIGNPLIALLILTDRDPARAFGFVMRRLGYLIVPLSLVLIRYVPELGRSFTVGGAPMNTGVASQKNELGQSAMLVAATYLWLLMSRRQHWREWSAAMRMASLGLLLASLYVLDLSDSQTAVVCLAVIATVLFVGSRAFVLRSPARMVWIVVGGGIFLALFEAVFDLSGAVYALLDRNPTLTNRTEIWALLIEFQPDPLFGAGFMAFWSGERLAQLWNLIGAPINQAHNGYLEQYLNLGVVGLVFMALLLSQALWRIARHASDDPAMSALRLALIAAVVLYNYTEASFYGINNMWLMTLIAMIQTSGVVRTASLAAEPVTAAEEGAGSRRDDPQPAGGQVQLS